MEFLQVLSNLCCIAREIHLKDCEEEESLMRDFTRITSTSYCIGNNNTRYFTTAGGYVLKVSVFKKCHATKTTSGVRRNTDVK